jgi:hypothetical protein
MFFVVPGLKNDRLANDTFFPPMIPWQPQAEPEAAPPAWQGGLELRAGLGRRVSAARRSPPGLGCPCLGPGSSHQPEVAGSLSAAAASSWSHHLALQAQARPRRRVPLCDLAKNASLVPVGRRRPVTVTALPPGDSEGQRGACALAGGETRTTLRRAVPRPASLRSARPAILESPAVRRSRPSRFRWGAVGSGGAAASESLASRRAGAAAARLAALLRLQVTAMQS